MIDFDTARQTLGAARERLAVQRAELYRTQQRTAALAARLARSRRVSTPDGAAASQRLAQQLDALKRDEARQRKVSRDLAAAVADAEGAFAAASTMQAGIARCSGGTPILLLPVRLETRFHESELWVRIYPDDCAVDSFEPDLSEDDIASAQQFWIAVWAAGGVEGERRAAWRDLVRARGTGRAAWIIKQYKPQGAEPVRTDFAPLLLVIATTQLPSATEQAALAAYWKAVWRANGARDAIEQAAFDLTQTLLLNAADAATLTARFTPANLSVRPAPPTQRAAADVDVVWLALPAGTDPKSAAWTAPAQVTVLPDRFVILGYQGEQLVFEAEGAPIPSPLVVGPDPSAAPEDQLQHAADGSLVIPEEMRWMTDFDRAVQVGMGMKISLDPTRVDASRPISRVIAIGLKLSEDADGGRERLEQLLTAHRYGSGGFSLAPQGTPTNNTEGVRAAGARGDADADASYDVLFTSGKRLEHTPEWDSRQDGQWLADALGIDPDVFQHVPHASDRDFAEARAMNRVLWPATLGYSMETMLHPVFGADTVDTTRWFYTHFVAGRGFLPSIRVGSQPYGVLPALNLQQWKLGNDSNLAVGGLRAPAAFAGYVQRLFAVLTNARSDWTALVGAVNTVEKPGDAHQILLDILGLHPASVEWHQRYGESFAYLFNRLKFDGLGARLVESVNSRGLQEPAMQLLRRLGYQGAVTPDGLQRFFFSHAQSLNGPVIDDRPLSESDPVRAYAAGNRNYLAWAADAVRESLEDLRQERGFINDIPPNALLYVVLRHALLLGYWDSALRLHVARGVVDSGSAQMARAEPSAIHVAPERAAGSESRYAYLYARDARVSGNASITVGEHIRDILGQDHSAEHLADQLAALDMIKDLPTARLERCFAEHIDTASYRLDAWLMGLVHLNLASMRYADRLIPSGAPSAEVETRRGLYLGSYGYVENLQRRAPLESVALSGDLAAIFDDETNPLRRDPTSGGYVMAPSASQATTAAILRAGYIANASPQAPDALAVDLSSARVRQALGLIQAIRNGQPLGAVLGYRFQRGLHEDHAPLELDVFIHAMRSVFPLVANNIASTQDASAPIETIEANNVIDGLKLIERVRQLANRQYPFGLALPAASPAESAAIDAEVDRLLESHDALADLALAEGVHQAVLGNYGAVGAALDAYAKGSFPPEPEFVRTRRGGVTLTHRMGVHFDAGAVSPVPVASSPRAHALTPVNQWLAAVLPDPTLVGCRVEWRDPVSGTAEEEIVTQQDLALQPIDLLYVVTLDGAATMDELDDRIIRHVLNKRAPRSDAAFSVRHTVRLAPPLKTFFELAPLLRHLRTLLLAARPLVPTDIALTGEAEEAEDAAQSIARTRASRPVDELAVLGASLATFAATAVPIDTALDQAVSLFERAARFGLQQVGWGFLYAWRQRVFAGLVAKMQDVIARWHKRLGDFDVAAAAYDGSSAALTEQQRFDALARMDLLVAALPVSPRPATPDDYDDLLRGSANPQARRRLFADKLTALEALLANDTSSLAALLQAIQSQLPLTAFDLANVSVDDAANEVAVCQADLQVRLEKLEADVDQRVANAGDALAAHDQAASSRARIESLQAAATAVFGAAVKLIPQFTLTPDHAAEIANAYAQGSSGALFQYLHDTKQSDFPVEDWLHGVARVREKMYAWEQMGLFAPILGGTEPALTPLQLPHRAGEGWLGLQFDPRQSLSGDRLLYTAHFAVPPGSAAMCGLLLDEWTEVLPARDETVGMSFHYDRPGSEPPQAWLLATPTNTRAPWRWSDLVGAVSETFALAKLRAVEPTQIDSTPYASFLPATATASALRGISIAANFANVNNVNAFVQGGGGG
jgi:hypothetical protein